MAEQKTGFSLTPSTWVDVTFSSDQVTVRGDGNVLIPSFRKQFLPLVSPPHPHNAEPAALMLDPFCLVFFLLVFIFETLPTMMLVILLKRKRDKTREIERNTTNTDETQKKKKKRAEKNCLKLQKAEHEQNGAASKLKCCSRKQEELEGMGRIIYKAPL